MDFAAVDVAAHDHHSVAMSVVGAAARIDAQPPPEFAHHHDGQALLEGMKVAHKGVQTACKDTDAVREIARAAVALVIVGIPAAEIDRRGS